MRHYLLFLFIVILCSCGEADKPAAEKPRSSKFSTEFNSGFQSFLDDYYAMSEMFVKWDSAGVTPLAGTMIKEMDSLKFENKDSVARNKFLNVRTDLNAQLLTISQTEVSLENKRKSFDNFSEALYDYLRNIEYDAAKIYLHECTMPFNDTGRAVWLSRSENLRNPYLGISHPRYGSGMLECGTNEGTIDNTGK